MANSWHTIELPELLAKTGSNESGLTQEDAARRLSEYGLNRLPARKPPTLWGIFLHQFKSPLIYILAAAAAVSILIGEFTDAAFVALVLILNASIGTWQEWRAYPGAPAAPRDPGDRPAGRRGP